MFITLKPMKTSDHWFSV